MKRNEIKILVETGIMLALAFILSYFRILKMPQGGSVSLQMVPLFLIALRWGFKPGLMAGIVYGIMKTQGPDFWFVHWFQFILDYLLAFSVIGIAGLFRKNYLIGITLAGALRFASHFLAGVIFFGEYANEGQSVWAYSAGYNITYLLPEILLVIFIIPFIVKKLKDLPQGDSKNEALTLVSLILPLLLFLVYRGEKGPEIYLNYQLFFRILITAGWLTTFGLGLFKFIKEKEKTPLLVLINTQIVVIIIYYILVNFFF